MLSLPQLIEKRDSISKSIVSLPLSCALPLYIEMSDSISISRTRNQPSHMSFGLVLMLLILGSDVCGGGRTRVFGGLEVGVLTIRVSSHS